MKIYEILEKFTHVDSEYYEGYRARTLMESPEFYLQLVADIQKLVKESDSLPCVSEILEKLLYEKNMAHCSMVDCIQEVDNPDEANRYEGEERAYEKAIEIVSSR